MTWFDWTLIAIWSISALLTVGQVGQPRKPLGADVAVGSLVLCVALVVGLLLTRGVF